MRSSDEPDCADGPDDSETDVDGVVADLGFGPDRIGEMMQAIKAWETLSVPRQP